MRVLAGVVGCGGDPLAQDVRGFESSVGCGEIRSPRMRVALRAAWVVGDSALAKGRAILCAAMFGGAGQSAFLVSAGWPAPTRRTRPARLADGGSAFRLDVPLFLLGFSLRVAGQSFSPRHERPFDLLPFGVIMWVMKQVHERLAELANELMQRGDTDLAWWIQQHIASDITAEKRERRPRKTKVKLPQGGWAYLDEKLVYGAAAAEGGQS